EADRLRLGGQLHELLRLHPPDHRVVAGSGAQILGDRDQLAPGLVQVPQRPRDLRALLAHAQDQVRLGHQPGRARPGEHLQRPRVRGRGADAPEDARDGLQVVRQHLRPGAEDLGELVRLAVEVGDQQLHPAAGHARVDLADGLGVQPGAAVAQVVAGHPGHGRVTQAHALDRLGYPPRLVGIQRGGPAAVDLAEVTPAGADLAADQERRLPILPAFEDVRAARLLADSVQALPGDERTQLGVLRAHRGLDLDPRRLLLDRGGGVARLQPQQTPTLGCDSHTHHRTSAGVARRHYPREISHTGAMYADRHVRRRPGGDGVEGGRPGGRSLLRGPTLPAVPAGPGAALSRAGPAGAAPRPGLPPRPGPYGPARPRAR